jgi:ketosteroid isomerase-like protein
VQVTVERVRAAYAALASGDMAQVSEYWAEEMNWLVPGHHPLAGWYHGRDAFLGFMGEVGRLSGGSFKMEEIAIMTNGEYSADVTHNLGYRAGNQNAGEQPYLKLDIDVVHVLRWRDGKVIEGRGAIFGDGTTQFDQFWSPVGRGGERLAA